MNRLEKDILAFALAIVSIAVAVYARAEWFISHQNYWTLSEVWKEQYHLYTLSFLFGCLAYFIWKKK